MAWLYPSSTSTTDTVALDLGTTSSAFVGEDVLIFAETDFAIQGTGNNHVLEISGEVGSAAGAIVMGKLDGTETTGNAVFIDSGGTVDCTSVTGAGVGFWGNGNLLVNDGTITSAFAGVYVKSDVMVANRIVNHGTISGDYGILGANGLGERIVWNRGRIEGTTASYGYQPDNFLQTVDIIHNRGTMVGSVFLEDNDDQFFGANGKLTGTLYGGGGDDQLYLGAGNNVIDGGDGADTISGGAGADRITGGDGKDTILYSSTNDSTFKHPDTLTDLTTNDLDSIDLHLIDANTKKKGDQAFDFSENHSKIGALWLDFVPEKGIIWIYGETDGDKEIDFAIKWMSTNYHGDEISAF